MAGTGIAHLTGWLVGLAVVALVGYLTRGWFLRVAGWVYAGMAAAVAALIPVDPAGVVGDVLVATLLGGVAIVLWCWGHHVYARRTGRWRSSVAYEVLDPQGAVRRFLPAHRQMPVRAAVRRPQ